MCDEIVNFSTLTLRVLKYICWSVRKAIMHSNYSFLPSQQLAPIE